MKLFQRLYFNIVLQTVIEDYNRKIKKFFKEEEEIPAEIQKIRLKFKSKVNSILKCNKYDELILKIKEYESIKEIIKNNK